MPAATSIAIAGLALSAGSAAVSHRQQRKAASKQKKANRLEQRKSDISAARENKRALAAQQSAIASAQAQGAATGLGDSSALAGSVGSVQTQTTSNIGFAEQINDLTKQQNSLAQKASNNLRTAGNAQAVGSLAQSALGAYSAFSAPPTPRIRDSFTEGSIAARQAQAGPGQGLGGR